MEFMNTNPHTTYTSEKGRPYRVSGIEKIPDSDKWINSEKIVKFQWIVNIIFTDTLSPLTLKLYYNHDNTLSKTEII